MTVRKPPPQPELPRFAIAQRLVHWIMAPMVLVALAIGLTLGLLGFDATVAVFGVQMTNTFYITHKTLGVLLLGLIVLRIALRLTLGKPRYAIALSRPQRIASEAVHGTIYLLLLAMPVAGWVATASGGFPIDFFHWQLPPLIGRNDALSAQMFRLHGLLGWTLLVLIAGHVAAALFHWRVRRDGVMQRMSLFRSESQRVIQFDGQIGRR